MMVLSSGMMLLLMLLLATVGQGFVIQSRKSTTTTTTWTRTPAAFDRQQHTKESWTQQSEQQQPGASTARRFFWSLAASKQRISSSSSSSTLARTPCKIVVVGVGGAGCNAVTRMLQTTVDLHCHQHNEIEFWAVNTDYQALGKAQAAGANVMTIGGTGLGAGGLPDNGRVAAESARQAIRDQICRPDVDLVFITAGMGGGTGSGAAPVIAQLAVAANCLTVAVVTTPFLFEGMHRRRQANRALQALQEAADTVIAVSNDKLLQMIPSETPLDQAFLVADDILRQGVVGIADVIVRPGLINVDFADVKAILKKQLPLSLSLDDDDDSLSRQPRPPQPVYQNALMGIGVGTGPHAALEAADAAITSPLLEQQILDSATSVVFCISGGKSLTLQQVNTASQRIYQSVSPTANVIFGAVIDETMGDDISITVLATGGIAPPVLDKPAPVARYSSTTSTISSTSSSAATATKARAIASTTSGIAARTTTPQQKVPSFLKNRKPSAP